jgi:hypothetical protein
MRKLLSALTLTGVALSAIFLSSSGWADTLELQENAPDKYVVVKGDTLWDISGKFLQKPWRWPEIWQLNKESIKDPHWIYPGDVVLLDRSGDQPKLTLVPGEGHGLSTVKLSPYVREEKIESGAIPTIPTSAIHAFLSQPRVVSAGAMDSAPFILGSNEDRVVYGRGDDVFATGGPADVKRWNILRPGKKLVDPETGELLGYEVEYLGDARTLSPGAPQKIQITHSAQEILTKDKLVAAAETTTFEYAPHAPETQISGRIISAYGAISETGRYQTVVLNRGANHGLEPGHVLAIYQTGNTVKLSRDEQDKISWLNSRSSAVPGGGAWLYTDLRCLKQDSKLTYDQSAELKAITRTGCLNQDDSKIKLPDARNGLVMVYRVFDKVSYALVMQSEGPVYLLDTVKNP